MVTPATPLSNEAAIAQLNTAINTIVDDIVRPTTLQTKANAEAIAQNAEAIERTEAICLSNARSIAAEGDAVSELRHSVDILKQSSDDVAAETSSHEERIASNEQRFEAMLAEAREDRKRLDAVIEEARADRESFRKEMQAMREERDQRFNAQMEAIRAQLLEIGRMNRRIGNLEQAS